MSDDTKTSTRAASGGSREGGFPEGFPDETSLQETAFRLEKMERMELMGRRVRLSDGREGPIVHVEYESPERVALVMTHRTTPSPLTRAGIDRLSPGHLPYIVELLGEPASQEEKPQDEAP